MSGFKNMKCEGCGGVVEYEEGQGLFKCKFCGSTYEASADAEGAVTAINIVQKRLDTIETHARTAADAQTESRLQQKAAAIQDKLDYQYVQWQNSGASRMGSAAIFLWIVGLIVFIIAIATKPAVIVLALAIIGGGVGLFLGYRKARANYEATVAQMKQEELDPVFAELKRLGESLGTQISIGYTESTAVPQRYCVGCHQNVTPVKVKGSHGAFHGINAALTVFTCGLWAIAWFIMSMMGAATGAAKRAASSGQCPSCGSSTLFPARIPNA